MSRQDLKGWAPVVLTLVGMVVAAGFFVAAAVADAKVQPVETRVSVLESDQKRQDAVLSEMRSDLKELVKWHRDRQ